MMTRRCRDYLLEGIRALWDRGRSQRWARSTMPNWGITMSKVGGLRAGLGNNGEKGGSGVRDWSSCTRLGAVVFGLSGGIKRGQVARLRRCIRINFLHFGGAQASIQVYSAEVSSEHTSITTNLRGHRGDMSDPKAAALSSAVIIITVPSGS
jgi:hypothetical protein